MKPVLYPIEFVDALFPVYKPKKWGIEIHLLFSILKAVLSGLLKKRFIWGWVILVIPILCRSRWISLIVMYICTILMVLTSDGPALYLVEATSVMF